MWNCMINEKVGLTSSLVTAGGALDSPQTNGSGSVGPEQVGKQIFYSQM
jgi:hypothetical protein